MRDSNDAAGRLTYLDWLRVLATLMVFFFHSARPFDHDGWHIKNGELSDGFTAFIFVTAQFIMPLFFFMSGTSSFHALKRGTGPYLKSRITRLLVPLLFGIFVVIAPVQVWIERTGSGQFTGSFVEFYPHYFEGMYGFGGNFAWMGLHLWYLEMLFLFSLITLPLFAWMRRNTADRTSPGEKNLSPLIFIVPLVAVELLVNLDPQLIGRRDWGGWSLLSHLVFFPAGFLCARFPRFIESMARGRYIYLLAAIPFTIAGYAGSVLQNAAPPTAAAYLLFCCWHGIVPWLWIFALTGLATKHLTGTSGFLRYSSKAVLPFYVLHQTVIVLAFAFILPLDLPAWGKYIILCPVSFLIIMALYELAVRRWRPLRFLFGMK